MELWTCVMLGELEIHHVLMKKETTCLDSNAQRRQLQTKITVQIIKITAGIMTTALRQLNTLKMAKILQVKNSL